MRTWCRVQIRHNVAIDIQCLVEADKIRLLKRDQYGKLGAKAELEDTVHGFSVEDAIRNQRHRAQHVGVPGEYGGNTVPHSPAPMTANFLTIATHPSNLSDITKWELVLEYGKGRALFLRIQRDDAASLRKKHVSLRHR